MHLAAMNGHAAVVKYFLSHSTALVKMNGNKKNILDIAVASEFREVATVIAKHERSVFKSSFLFVLGTSRPRLFGFQRSTAGAFAVPSIEPKYMKGRNGIL